MILDALRFDYSRFDRAPAPVNTRQNCAATPASPVSEISLRLSAKGVESQHEDDPIPLPGIWLLP